jgi:hypothetical protein
MLDTPRVSFELVAEHSVFSTIWGAILIVCQIRLIIQYELTLECLMYPTESGLLRPLDHSDDHEAFNSSFNFTFGKIFGDDGGILCGGVNELVIHLPL